ncbi:polysaccharide biosynthesis tyrosine autokinase [Flavobacteriaceae bacterium KMM 6897]|nr:polysaccharide biosynthesis tyrosine autokinase [Flavobacteriaceae bacterium KMM 6897]
MIQGNTTETTDLKEILSVYTKQWKWFVISVVIGLLIAFAYLRYETPEYLAEAKIQIIDEDNSSPSADLLGELNFLSGNKNNIEDEIQLINSRSNFIEVVKELKLNIKVEVIGNVKSSELYKNTPVYLNLIAPDSTLYNSDLDFYVSISSPTTFGFSLREDEPERVHSFGNKITSQIGDIVFTPNLDAIERFKGKRLKLSIEPITKVAQDYRDKISIRSIDEVSNIVNISLEDPIKDKAKDIINSLIRIYNENAIEDKKIIADRTSNFINERIANISSSLSSVDQSAEDFKTDRGVTDIASEANINLNVGVANQQELANARMQMNIASSMMDIVDQQDRFEVLPANVGLSDPSINNATAKYNELVLERNRLLKSSNAKNPVIVNLDQQITGLKNSMQSSLSSTVNNLGMQVNTLSGQQAIFNSRIYSAPKNERELRDITRKQQTTESLYLYLLQKREESQIAVASTSQKSKVIDYAYNPTELPVSPKRSIVFLASLILGLLVPFSIIYIKELLDNKVHNMHSLEKKAKEIPVLGELPKLSKKEQKLVIKEDRSVLAESLRIIRTNLDYLIKTKRSKSGNNNIIFVTSSVPGEGKTFLSSNLSMILASTNKKVLLVGADIRNPKLYSFFTSSKIDSLKKDKQKRDLGLTEFLFDDTVSISDIINPMLVYQNTIDVIYSGKIPPNPSELLMSSRLKDLFSNVSEDYDYVIVDTAPLMVVSDTLLISEYANHTIYVTRAGVTEEKAIEFPLKLQEEGKIKGLCFVVNDVKATNLGYGGKYGYGYGKSIKKWWKFNT